MTRSEAIRFLILRSIGNFLLLFAIFGVIATFGPAIFFEIQYQLIRVRGVHYTVVAQAKPPQTGFGKITNKYPQPESQPTSGNNFASILTGSTEQILVPKDTQFSILIPKIGASAKIYPNIDASNPDEFLPILQQGIAHAKGSVFPGMKGNIYLFAHSTDNFWDVGRYNAVFYLLKDLTPGDQVVIFFENVRHDYTVVDSKIVDPSEVSYLMQSQKASTETLIMQTCWPPGTTWQRLLVFAQPQ